MRALIACNNKAFVGLLNKCKKKLKNLFGKVKINKNRIIELLEFTIELERKLYWYTKV